MAARHPILTIGHSNYPLTRFFDLLRGAEVTAVADVRSAPVSCFLPHFNKDRLAASLAENGIAYIFLGKELGGRPEQPELLSDGIADYERWQSSSLFRGSSAPHTNRAREADRNDVRRG